MHKRILAALAPKAAAGWLHWGSNPPRPHAREGLHSRTEASV